jgi:hypothetical protein
MSATTATHAAISSMRHDTAASIDPEILAVGPIDCDTLTTKPID